MNIYKYLELEENLFKEQLSVERHQRVKAYIQRLDERLAELTLPKGEHVKTSIKSAESLNKLDMEIPLKVKGVFLTEGRPKARFYSSDELEKASKNASNQSFRIMQDHRNDETSMIVGKVDSIQYDSVIKGIRWIGHINDERTARNILDKLIDEVSVTVFSTKDWSDKYGVIGYNLEFSELSTVIKGAEPKNSLEPVL